MRHFLWLDKVRTLVFFVVFVDVVCIFSASVRCEPVFFFFLALIRSSLHVYGAVLASFRMSFTE